MDAEEIDDDRREDMIYMPEEVDGNQVYQVSSFVENAVTGYSVRVNVERNIMDCTCYDYTKRLQHVSICIF